MAWERRDRGGYYYTRSHKVAGRVQREYVGRGPIAEEAAALDATRRAERQARAEGWRAERESLDALEGRVAEVDQAAESVARTALMLAGFARHHRGEWRRRRG